MMLVVANDTCSSAMGRGEDFVERLSIGVGCVLVGLASASHAQTLSEAVQAAWRLNPDTSVAASGMGEAEGQMDVAKRWLVAPPTASLSQRNDRLGADEGFLAHELEFEVPLWRWGQRVARLGFAKAGVELVDAEIRLARWQVAGEVRESLWAAAVGDLELETARQRLKVAERIEQEVGRHVAVGDLARADLLLVQSEKAAAQANVADAEQRANESRQRYAVLTGLQGWTLPTVKDDGPPVSIEQHPRVQRAAIDRQRAERAGENARESDNEPYTLVFGAERERARYGAANNTIVRLGVKVPFGGSGWNRPTVAAAGAARVRAELNESAARRAVDADIANARTALQTAERNLELAMARLRAAEEHAGFQRRGFSLGESGLAVLLRAESLLLEAQAGVTRQEILIGQARSRLEHSLGLLP